MARLVAVTIGLPDTLPADDPSVADDRRFLDDWERGAAHGLSAIPRMRQLHYAQVAQVPASAALDHAAA